MSSQTTKATARSTSAARAVMSPRFPMGVATRWRVPAMLGRSRSHIPASNAPGRCSMTAADPRPRTVITSKRIIRRGAGRRWR